MKVKLTYFRSFWGSRAHNKKWYLHYCLHDSIRNSSETQKHKQLNKNFFRYYSPTAAADITDKEDSILFVWSLTYLTVSPLSPNFKYGEYCTAIYGADNLRSSSL